MDWKDVLGQIVQSGKFTFLLDGVEYKIHAYIPSTNHLDLISVKGKDYQTVSVDECQLIVRPISDMSDEEKLEYAKTLHSDYDPNEHRIYFERESPESFLYLLSRGVLPESFVDEDVIWEGKGA